MGNNEENLSETILQFKGKSLSVNSIWETVTRKHAGTKRRVVGFNKSGTSVHLRYLGKYNNQHREKVYSVPTEIFLLQHKLIKDGK